MKQVYNGLMSRFLDATEGSGKVSNEPQFNYDKNILETLSDTMEIDFPSLEDLYDLDKVLEGVNDEYPFYDDEWNSVKRLIHFYMKWMESKYE